MSWLLSGRIIKRRGGKKQREVLHKAGWRGEDDKKAQMKVMDRAGRVLGFEVINKEHCWATLIRKPDSQTASIGENGKASEAEEPLEKRNCWLKLPGI